MAVVHSDAFTVGANTNLDAYGDWEELRAAGDMVVNAANDNLVATVASQECMGRWNGTGSPTGDQETEADIVFAIATGTFVGVAVKLQAAALSGYSLVASVEDDTIDIYEYASGTGTSLVSDAFTFNDSTTYNLRLRSSGSGSMEGWVDDVSQVTVTDTTFSSGLGGVHHFVTNSGDATWDNFVLDDLDAGGGSILLPMQQHAA